MGITYLSYFKQVLIAQLLSILFAIISEIHMRLLIAYELMFTNSVLFYIEMIILIIIFTILITHFLDSRWLNILFISIPYIIYWFIVMTISSKIYPTHTDSNDYGFGLMAVFVSIYQWISVVIASVIGTYLKRRYFHGVK